MFQTLPPFLFLIKYGSFQSRWDPYPQKFSYLYSLLCLFMMFLYGKIILKKGMNEFYYIRNTNIFNQDSKVKITFMNVLISVFFLEYMNHEQATKTGC